MPAAREHDSECDLPDEGHRREVVSGLRANGSLPGPALEALLAVARHLSEGAITQREKQHG